MLPRKPKAREALRDVWEPGFPRHPFERVSRVGVNNIGLRVYWAAVWVRAKGSEDLIRGRWLFSTPPSKVQGPVEREFWVCMQRGGGGGGGGAEGNGNLEGAKIP